MALWRRLYAGRDLFRLAAGPGWIKLHLAGDERAGLLLSGIPGAHLVLRGFGPLPAPLAAALPLTRKHPLQILLADAQLVSCGLLPDDRVVAFHLRRPRGDEVVLLHQLFGAQANTTVVDRRNKLLWSVHRPPHPALASWPPDATWHHGADTDAPADFDDLALAHLARACAARVLTTNRTALGRRRKSVIRLLANLDRDLANAEQGDQHRRKAEALAATLHTLRRGQAAVTVPDLTDGTPLTIALDPARTPAANLEMWFRRARKADKGREIIRARRDQTATEAERLAAAAERLTAMTTETADALAQLTQGLQWRTDHADLFRQGGDRPRSHSPDEPVRPFRRYLVDGVWPVWVGRNNQENDELTHRAAHNRDIWLHAQGVAGSHVILRTGGHPERVPRAVLEKAAALAALNSKARHSQIVPVIHTEKRYVRKPRKAQAGTAVCLRDQSLFVEPGIRTGVEPA